MSRTALPIGSYRVLTKASTPADDETASTKSSVSGSPPSLRDVEPDAERERAMVEGDHCVDCSALLPPCAPAACDGKQYCDTCWMLWGMQASVAGPKQGIDQARGAPPKDPDRACTECGVALRPDAQAASDGKRYCNHCSPPAPLQAKRVHPKRPQGSAGQQRGCGGREGLLPTFAYAGSLDKHPPYAMYDIRDEVCLRVGGFKHGQVVHDNADGGKELVVVGVRCVDGAPRLWFQPRSLGRPGAGAFPGASAGVLQERLYPAASLPPGKVRLHEAQLQSSDEVEDADGEIMLLCRHCRLPLGDFVYADDKGDGHLHGECMAQLLLDREQEEEDARAKLDTDLKEKHRIEYGLGWTPAAIPCNSDAVAKLGCAMAPSSMCCLVLNEDSRSVSIEAAVGTTGHVNLEYLSTALRVRLLQGTEPYFSLDPIAPGSAQGTGCDSDRTHWMQAKRFEPEWLAGTGVGEILFQADYHLKELSMGEYEQPVVGMRSCVDVFDTEELQREWRAREWFVVRQAEVLRSHDSVLVPEVTMGVEAREQECGPDGVEDKPITRSDHPLVKYAEAFTHNFDLIAERKSVIYHLRELAKASVLAKFLMESDIYLEDSWFNMVGDIRSAYCQEVPQLWNERFFSKIQMENGEIVDADVGIDRSKHGVYGGVDFGLDQLVVGRSQKVPISIQAQFVPKAGVVGARVSSAARLQGVDLCLDKFDLSTTSSMKLEDAPGSWDRCPAGRSFWPSIDGGSESGASPEDEKLLKAVFNPHLSDRRVEGDQFVPPDTAASYVQGLRGLVTEEEDVQIGRKEAFRCKEFAMNNPGPLFPSSWTPQFEIANMQLPSSGIADVAFHRNDKTGVAPVSLQEMKPSAELQFSKSTEDGTQFRIYRYSSFEVRTTQDHGGEETVEVVFSLSASVPETARRKKKLSIHDHEPVTKVMEYVESVPGEVQQYRSYVVLETEEGNSVVTEQLPDGTASWQANPEGLESRNFRAKVVRSAGCASGRTLGEVRARQASPESGSKRYAQRVFNEVGAGAHQGASGFWQRSGNAWQLLKTGRAGQQDEPEATPPRGWRGDGGNEWQGWDGQWQDAWDGEWQGAWDGEWEGCHQGAEIKAILPRQRLHLVPVSTKVARTDSNGTLGCSDQQVATYFKNKMQIFQRHRRAGGPTAGLLWQSNLDHRA